MAANNHNSGEMHYSGGRGGRQVTAAFPLGIFFIWSSSQKVLSMSKADSRSPNTHFSHVPILLRNELTDTQRCVSSDLDISVQSN